MRNLLVKGALPLAILVFGMGIFLVLKWSRKAPERQVHTYQGPLVEVVEAPLQTLQMVVEGQGTVQPGAQVDLVPQVAGIVVWKSAKLTEGSYFKKGDLLARIDPEDYQLVVEQAEAQVAVAGYQLEVRQEEAEVARQEWVRVHQQEEASALALQIPQLKAAEAEFAAARARLSEARLRLRRTELLAPFDGRVKTARLDAGQFVAPGVAVARLYSIEWAEIVVHVPDEDLAWFTLPGPEADGASPLALVKGELAGYLHTWNGQVVRTGAGLDAQSRMAQVIVEVQAPYGDGTHPLMPGMFVDIEILGHEVEGVRMVPRKALRQGNAIWAVGDDGILHIRQAQVLRARQQNVVVRVELQPGEQVVVSYLEGMTDGMRVRSTREEGR